MIRLGPILLHAVFALTLATVTTAANPDEVTAAERQQFDKEIESIDKLSKELEFDEAIPRGRRLLAETERRYGKDSIETARVIESLLVALSKASDDIPEQVELVRRALRIRENAPEVDLARVAQNTTYLANKLMMLQQFEEAYGLVHALIDRLESADTVSAEWLAQCHRSLALLAIGQGDHAGALVEIDQSLELMDRYDVKADDLMGLFYGIRAEQLKQLGRYDAALDSSERSLSLLRSFYGDGDPRAESHLFTLGQINERLGNLDLAVEQLKKAMAAVATGWGADSYYWATQATTLAGILVNADRYDEAAPYVDQAIEITERTQGPDAMQMVQMLDRRAIIQFERGEYDAALATSARVVSIAEMHHPEGSIVVAIVRHIYAEYLMRLGDVRRARPLIESALLVFAENGLRDWEKNALSDLCSLNGLAGDLITARRACEESLSLHQDMLDPKSPALAETLHGVASVYLLLGDPAAARERYREALELYESAPGEIDRARISVLLELAWAEAALGNRDKADAAVQRAIGLWEEAGRVDAWSVTTRLCMWADIQVGLGRIAVARSITAQAREALEQHNPALPDRSIGCLSTQARIEAQSGNLAEALALYDKAVAASDHLEHDTLAQIEMSSGRAAVLWAQGRAIPAFDLAIDTARRAVLHFDELATRLTQQQALFHSPASNQVLTAALSALASGKIEGEDAVTRTWEQVVRIRGAVLDELALRHRQVLAGSPEALTRLYELDAARNRLTQMVSVGTVSRDDDERGEKLSDVWERKRRAEQNLADASARYRSRVEERRVDWQSVREALPPDSALVAYLQYERLPDPVEDQPPGPPRSSFLAFVQVPGRHPYVVPLGLADEIDELVRSWRQSVGHAPLAIGKPHNQPLASGTALRKAIWDPLALRIEDLDRIFIVPDGSLNLISFGTLPLSGKQFLVEAPPALHYLSAERDLTRGFRGDPAALGLLLVGAPDYDWTTASDAEVVSPEIASHRSPPAQCGELADVSFGALPATTHEVVEIERLWHERFEDEDSSVLRLEGASAREEEFKQLAPSYRVIHLATHGYFAQGRCRSILQDRESGVGIADNPMLLSGLVLAGANRRGDIARDAEDGMLTAEEIASLDLTGNEWVVLSACETGVGDVIQGEGVFGLRRGFQIAGAGTLVMSLWRVQDEATREWMQALYSHRLSGSSTAESVRAATVQILRARRTDRRSSHPYFWGSFVASGDWR